MRLTQLTFFREQYFQNVLDVFSVNSISKMREQIKFNFVLFTLKLKVGMIKILKINLNEEVKLKFN
jgi:hypothetical protein